MNMLLHICCAPCAIYPLVRLREAGLSVRGYWYNPNIHPYREYEKRMSTVREFAGKVELRVSYRDGYDLDEFLVRTAGKGSGRCEQCYRMRLDAVAAEAKNGGHGHFTTTLLYSKYQKHDLIRGIAKEMAEERGVELYYEDFRVGWSFGVKESKAMGLYRQQYCGCVYSERERYHTDEQASSHADRSR